MDPLLARKTWRTAEPLHAFIYFVPEADEQYEAAGLEPGRMGYFASRGAALGPVPAEVIIATFFNFWPGLVRPVIPMAWELASPGRILDARTAAADGALRRALGDEACTSAEMVELGTLLRRAAEAAAGQPEGRPLFAAHAALEWPDVPHLVVWWAETLLREFRGDGHNAALLAANVDGCQCHVLAAACGGPPREMLQVARGWTDDEWDSAEAGLTERGLLVPGRPDEATEAGRALRDSIELCTDQTDLAPWRPLGADATERLHGLLRPLAKTVAESGVLPGVNPIGIRW